MRTIYDAGLEAFQAELVGQKVVSASKDTITLESGKVLVLEDTAECCAWFSASDIEMIDLSDNVVTSVAAEDLTPESTSDYDDQHYRVNILSNAGEIAKFEIEGNASNGYYCHSINLLVKGIDW